jgi:purine nucleosidase
MKYDFDVKESRKIRVILCSDAKNEADDQYAIVHALMTPKFIVKGLVATHFQINQTTDSMQASYDEIMKLLELMHREDSTGVYHGAEGALADTSTPRVSDGAKCIINEAKREDSTPLFVVCIGALTDLASAYLMDPSISARMTAIWIGGGTYPDGHSEFNLINDIHAANVVFQSSIPLWQVPMNTNSVMKVSLAELQYKVKPYGRIGKYLFEQLVAVTYDDEWNPAENRVLWDSSAIGLLLDEHHFHYDTRPAPGISQDMYYMHNKKNREIRVYRHMESRFILEDFFCKLAIQYPQQDS